MQELLKLIYKNLKSTGVHDGIPFFTVIYYYLT